GMEMLCFRLPGHGDTTLKHMNSLRARQHFCDITIVASNNQTFRGHKVVLAACSPFLRDQFLLNPSPKLQVSRCQRTHSAVVCDLLQSCYTGVLQFSPEEIVNYLTAASYLQMEHIVQRCRGALKKFIRRRMIASLNRRSSLEVSILLSLHLLPQSNTPLCTHTVPRCAQWRRDVPVCLLRAAVSTRVTKRSTGVDHDQDLWYLATAGLGGGFGLDYSQDGLKTGGYMSIELPQLDMGEKVSPVAANSLTQYGLEESSCGAGEGSSGMTANEGGDESVAVVGSTSSVTGPVICEHCGMTFPSAHSLAIHSRSTHLLYACPCCGKHFHHSANLNRHMAVHRGVGKTHQCPLCYKTFTQKSTLIDHMNLHSGERPHHCAYCHARFAHKPALRRHLKEQHGKTTVQNFLHEQEEKERIRILTLNKKD
uniref:Uncharacterized protein n=1 Tax=Mola mola TaxID=94237 RepID=A0A3Q3XAB5_MOLML